MCQTVGEFLRQEREKRNLSAKAMAQMLGYVPSRYEGYENGDHIPRPQILTEIAHRLRVDPKPLIELAQQQRGHL